MCYISVFNTFAAAEIFNIIANVTNAADAANAANAYIAFYASIAAAEAATAIAAADAVYANTYATAATEAAICAIYSYNTILKEVQADLILIDQLTAEAFLHASLWSSPLPKEWQQWLNDFKTDALSLDAGFEVWLDWYEERLQGKPIDVDLLEQWVNIPKEIDSQGVTALNAYLKNLVVKNATQPLNRVRAIFIGYGEAGKTSLIRALHNEPVTEGKEPMTAGIDIRDWPVPDTDIKAHFWDFGGQVMAHATHQFFLRSSCLYVLVLNARSEINGTEQAEYWLQHVKSFGGNAPVMIVGNKTDLASVNLDMAYLQGKYPSIVGFYPLSCTQAQTAYKNKFASFQEDFCEQLRKVGTHQMLFTQEQFAVLQDLRPYQEQSAFLKQDEFTALCQRHGIGEDGVQNRAWLLDILDKLGVVIHFPQLDYLDDYILNPRWLTHGVYTLMYHRQARLTDAEVVKILRDKPIYDEQGNNLDYSGHKCRFIMDAMHEFKLAYPYLLSRDIQIIPELLPSDQPSNIPFTQTGGLAFEFVFRGFLPRHVMPELIVSRHEEIVGENVWQCGVLLANKTYKAQALAKVDYHDRVLSITVQGADAKDYLSLLNAEVVRILARLDLDYQQMIALPLAACRSDRLGLPEEKAPYKQLWASANKGERSYTSPLGLDYDLGQVLGWILPKAQYQAISHHYHNSTVHQAEDIHMSDTRQIQTTTYIEGDIKDQAQVAAGNISNKNQTINNSTIHGHAINADTITNSFNTTTADTQTATLLAQLLKEIEDLNAKIPAEQAQALTRPTEILREASTSLDKDDLSYGLKKIKDTVITLGEIAKPVLNIAVQLLAL
ncbi:COR domain-containing protein [Methylovulum psychrotolerans]|nr:COR domain-containing protein [Methylovulum psychrotolerans]